MAIPSHVKYLIIGAGIHGLSTSYHLAQKLKASGRGDGRDILVVDKGGIAAGASGIACGVVRNNYFQPAMRELMAHSVGVWETDPEGYSYHAKTAETGSSVRSLHRSQFASEQLIYCNLPCPKPL